MNGGLELFLFSTSGPAFCPEDSPLHSDELDRARKMGDPKVRNQFIAGRTALRGLLSERLEIPAADVVIGIDKQGRPYVNGEDDVLFNISHSGPFLAIALGWGCRSLGVDLEVFRFERPARRLARRFFEPKAARKVIDAAENDVLKVFLQYWTVKESVLKAFGTGLRTPLRQVEVQPDPGWMKGRCVLRSQPSQTWDFFQWRKEGLWILSLAVDAISRKGRPELRLREFSVG